MQRIGLFLFFILSALPWVTQAYSVSCSSLPGGSSCHQCFGFTLQQTNGSSDVFSPRSGLTSTQQEWIDLSQSSISAMTYQGASITPTGNITSQFDLTDHAAGSGAWTWAQMKPGRAIVKGALPNDIDYTAPVYSVKFVTNSHIRENNTTVADTAVSHVECAYYFVSAPATICGNGVKEGEEQCDDGNTNSLDTCTNLCRFPLCGNAIKEGNEQCDDGNTNNNDGCSNTCYTPLCGNSIKEGNEQCDDGNTNNMDNCTNTCILPQAPGPICGNGIPEAGEQCDDGNTNNNDSCSAQCVRIVIDPRCHVQVLESQGTVPLNTSIVCSGEPQGQSMIVVTKNNSIISSFQTTQTPYVFSQVGRYTVHCYPDVRDQSNSCSTPVEISALCGNGIMERGEQCDDGNTLSGDSCDRYCRASGSTCGNGLLERHEQCDDGNNNNGDSCTNICQRYVPDTGASDIVWMLGGLSLLFSYILFRKYSSHV